MVQHRYISTDMDSPSHHAAQAAANSNMAKIRKRRRGGRTSNVSFSLNANAHDNDNDDRLPSTPIDRTTARSQLGTVSPFTFRSSQASPRTDHVFSPAVILFSGPAHRGFERLHDDSFPRDLTLLKSMARSKFKFAPSASIEMSYVNPDGVVCDLDDEHDLRAFEAHANLTPKLEVRVIPLTHTHEPFVSPTQSATPPPHPLTNGAATQALIHPLQIATPNQSAALARSDAPTPTHAKPDSVNGAPRARSRRKSSIKAAPPQPALASDVTMNKTRWEDREDAASIVARLLPDLASPMPSKSPGHPAEAVANREPAGMPAASHASPPAVKKPVAKRKRTDNSPPEKSLASPNRPVAKKPRGRAASISVAPAAASNAPAGFEPGVDQSQSVRAPAASVFEVSAPDTLAPPALQLDQDTQGRAETPKRSRASKSLASTSVGATQDAAASQTQASPETPRRGLAQKSAVSTTRKTTQDPAADQGSVSAETPKRGRPKKNSTCTSAAAEADTPMAPSQQTVASIDAASGDNVATPAASATESTDTAVRPPELNGHAASTLPEQSESTVIGPTKAAKSTVTSKPRGRPSKKASAEAETAAPSLEASQDGATSATPASAEEAPKALDARASPAKKARGTKACKPTTAADTETIPAARVPTSSTDAAPVVSEVAPVAPAPPKKKLGRPSKAAQPIAEAAAENASLSQAIDMPASSAQAHGSIVSADTSDAPKAAPLPPKKKLGRPTKAAKAAEAQAKADAAAAAAAASGTIGVAQAEATNELAVEQQAQAPPPGSMTSSDLNHPDSSQSDKDEAATCAAADHVADAPMPSSSASSAGSAVSALQTTQPETVSASQPAVYKQPASKPRASNAETKSTAVPVAADTCIACGATPAHESQDCPIWQGGSQTILDLLALIRNRKPKSQKDKELSRVLTDWLAKQFGAPTIDFSQSQDITKNSQQSSVAPNTAQGASGDFNGVANQIDPTQLAANKEKEAGSAMAASKHAQSKTTASKRSSAEAVVLAHLTPEPELPPPSGVEASSSHAAPAVAASRAKPAIRATRSSQNDKAVAASDTKSTKTSATKRDAEPKIALTPSSPAHPDSFQSPPASDIGLRAPSETSEAELATSPMLSAVPRANDDMDVDEMLSHTCSQHSTAAQQLEERKRKIKLAEQATSAGADERTSGSNSRSRSGSITSSDSSGDGHSSGDDSDRQSDAEPMTTKSSRRDSAKQAKSTLSKPSTTSADKQASSSDSDTSSTDSETESEPDVSKKSASRAKNATGKLKTPSATKASQRLPTPDNPFLRGLTPISSRPSNGTGNNSQKSTPFTRLSELKPAILRQNLSQPGSPLSTGGSTPKSMSSQTPFFASQPALNGNGNDSGSATDTPAVSAAQTPVAATRSVASDDDDDVESDSSSSSSSEDEAPRSRAKASRAKIGVAASTPAKRAGKRLGAAPASKPAAAKKRKNLFDVFG